jgi:hypothetical protein
VRISLAKIVLTAGVLFLLLAALNFSRNADYYERNKLSFGLAGLSEILAYVGSPFQVAVGSAKVADELAGRGGDEYRNWVDIEVNLNTNSAFALLLQQMGFISWPYICLTCLAMGFSFAALSSLGKTAFLLPSGAILYASAELWRLDLFQQGTFIVWFVAGIGVPIFLISVRSVVRTIDRAPRLRSAVDNRNEGTPGRMAGQ